MLVITAAGVNIFIYKCTSVREEFSKIGHLGKSFGLREESCARICSPFPNFSYKLWAVLDVNMSAAVNIFQKTKEEKS